MSNSEFGYRSTANEVVAGIDLSGKNVIVTGAYSGIGIETAKALAKAGAKVCIACRDFERAKKTADDINTNNHRGSVDAAQLNLADLSSVQDFVHQYQATHKSLDILLNNAAVMACPYSTTTDGFETQFGVNHLGHYALTRLLLPIILAAKQARVVFLSSTGHMISPVVFDDIEYTHRDYEPWLGYGQAKTANSLTAIALQSHYGDKLDAFAVHPGGIMTTLQRHMAQSEIHARGWVDENGNINENFKTPEQGASTSTWAATSKDLIGRGGAYLEDCSFAEVFDTKPQSPKGVMHYAVDEALALKLWDLSEQMIEKKHPGYFS